MLNVNSQQLVGAERARLVQETSVSPLESGFHQPLSCNAVLFLPYPCAVLTSYSAWLVANAFEKLVIRCNGCRAVKNTEFGDLFHLKQSF